MPKRSRLKRSGNVKTKTRLRHVSGSFDDFKSNIQDAINLIDDQMTSYEDYGSDEEVDKLLSEALDNLRLAMDKAEEKFGK